MKQSTFVKNYEFNNPDFDEVDYLLEGVIKILEKKFHSFEYRCDYDIKVTNITTNEEDILTITLGNVKS